jgi:PAS domain S-box-containing protein
LRHPAFLNDIFVNLGITRHAFERMLFLFPIVWSGFLFRWKGGMILLVVCAAIMLPRALIISSFQTDSLFETAMVLVVGFIVIAFVESVRGERERVAQLRVAERDLKSYISTIEENQRRLAALNETSNIVSHSLDLEQVLHGAADNVADVMKVDVVMIFLLNSERNRLELEATLGVPQDFPQKLGWLQVGEGLNGQVVVTGESLFIEDASNDPRLTKDVVRQENLRAMLVVPMKSKGAVVGTLCVAMRSFRTFDPAEVELLSAIGGQIGVAVENARLYQQERRASEQLRASETRYRQLFENAQDAIWLHDLEGNIIAANKAWSSLTGYDLSELTNIKEDALFSEETRQVLSETVEQLVAGHVVSTLAEIEMIRKDGRRAAVQLGTSLLFSDHRPVAVQHVGRDITQERRLQENLRYFSQQALRAQEEERKRIARELHDETLQSMVILSRQVDDLIGKTRPAGLETDAKALEDIREKLDGLTREIRRFSQDLRPSVLDHLGLLPALELLTTRLSENPGFRAALKVVGTPHRLPAEVELVLFRIIQEALNNVSRHSQATKAEVTAEFSNFEARFIIMDNGKGFEVPRVMGDLAREGKLGLAGMQERANLVGGTLTIQSAQGKGTTLTVVVPA